jgi:hypothetical protein
VAGPKEAAALDYVLVQARYGGRAGNAGEMRALLRRTQQLKRFDPDPMDWNLVEARLPASATYSQQRRRVSGS